MVLFWEPDPSSHRHLTTHTGEGMSVYLIHGSFRGMDRGINVIPDHTLPICVGRRDIASISTEPISVWRFAVCVQCTNTRKDTRCRPADALGCPTASRLQTDHEKLFPAEPTDSANAEASKSAEPVQRSLRALRLPPPDCKYSVDEWRRSQFQSVCSRLPIAEHKQEFLAAFKQHRVVVLDGVSPQSALAIEVAWDKDSRKRLR